LWPMTSHQKYSSPTQHSKASWNYTDLTQHWKDFIKTAEIPLDARGRDVEHIKLYVLVHSPSQQDSKAEEPINTTVKSQFSPTNWQQIRASYKAFRTRNPQGVNPGILFILDQQSTDDRKVIILQEDVAEWFTPEGEYADDTMQGREDLEKRTVWHKYRVPFEEAWIVQVALEGYCGLEPAEPWFEKDLMGDVHVEIEEESGEETDEDEDGTTSEDLEYM
jgi:hypothetical protein